MEGKILQSGLSDDILWVGKHRFAELNVRSRLAEVFARLFFMGIVCGRKIRNRS